jgi:hypothetical protein
MKNIVPDVFTLLIICDFILKNNSIEDEEKRKRYKYAGRSPHYSTMHAGHDENGLTKHAKIHALDRLKFGQHGDKFDDTP